MYISSWSAGSNSETTQAHPTPPRRQVPGVSPPRADVHQLVERGLEKRNIAVAPDSVAARTPDSGQHCDRRRVASGQVDERQTRLRRWPAGPAGEPRPPPEPLHHVVVPALRGSRPRHAEARKRAADDLGLHVLQLVVRETQLLRLGATKVRVNRVAL